VNIHRSHRCGALKIFALKAFVLIITCSFTAGAAAIALNGPVVETDKGRVRGFVTGTTREFLGIPYGAAPIRNLRWQPPQPRAPWAEVVDAKQFGNHCPQTGDLFDTPSVTEDCLNLNVYVPGPILPFVRRPVMVWLHGGGFHHGASKDYDPQKIAKMGNVVVVTLNYRLGMLGFLSHPALSAESPSHASGNYGLMDQQLALKWVQDNIAKFSGDRDNVTIFGESAGGVSVHAHLASPASAGLFHRAIIQSGAYSLTQPTLPTAEAQGVAFAAQPMVGCGSQTAACLRALPVQTILDNQAALIPFSAYPTVDGNVLPRSVKEAFASGQFHRVPVMEGSNHDEWSAFVAIGELISGAPLAARDYEANIAALPTSGSTFPSVAAIAAAYSLADYPTPSLAMTAAGTGGVFACPAHTSAKLFSQYTKTYQFEFSDPDAPNFLLPPVSFSLGAFHSSELPYLFNYIGLQLPNPPQKTAAQQKLADTMIRYWTRFARTGNPNLPGFLPHWPEYKVASHKFQSLVPSAIVTKTNFDADHRCAVWGF
jgi:para-nitrobenzyl esterase